METIDLASAFNNIIAQGPMVAFAVIVLWYTRKDLADEKADNKELRGQILKMHEAVLDVVTKNTTAYTLLSEKINGLEAG